jgi:hypothetical protein
MPVFRDWFPTNNRDPTGRPMYQGTNPCSSRKEDNRCRSWSGDEGMLLLTICLRPYACDTYRENSISPTLTETNIRETALAPLVLDQQSLTTSARIIELPIMLKPAGIFGRYNSVNAPILY